LDYLHLSGFVARAATGFYFFAIAKKSKQKRLVPLNRSAYRNGHAFYILP